MNSLAKLAGVSQATVSDILNGRWQAKRISRGLAERVQRIAREHHYRPNLLVRGMQTGRTRTVGLLLPDIKGWYFTRVAAGVHREAKRHGYHVLISEAAAAHDETAEIEVLLQRRVDGLLLVPRHMAGHRQHYRRLIGEGVPMVCVDTYFKDVPCPAVVGDDLRGGYLATSHLIAQGHRRIAHLALDLAYPHQQERLDGFRKAMAEHGLAVPRGYVVAATGDGALRRLLKADDRPTAIFAVTDYAAITAMKLAAAEGLRVPADVAFVGYSDCLENVDFLRVPLSSVHVDVDAMGRVAMRRLLDEIKSPARRHEVVRMPAGLVVRESSGGMR